MNKKFVLKDNIPLIAYALIFISVITFFQSMNHSFLSVNSIVNMIRTVSANAIAALGATFVVIIAGSDMSFYMTSCFSAMTMSFMIQEGFHPVIAILGGCAAAIFWGLIIGISIGKYKFPDIIMTIAVGSIAFGAAYIYSNGTFIYDNFMESGIRELSEFRILNIPLPVYIMATLYIASFILLHKTKHGRSFYAVGANKKSAYLSGVNVTAIIIVAYVVCSLFAGVSTMISTAAQGNGNVRVGLNLLMPAFSSVFLGFSILKRPCVIGTFMGAILTSVMTNGFIVINVPYYYGDMVIAAMLLIAIALSKADGLFKVKVKKAPKGTV